MIGQTRISVAAWAATALGAIVLVPVFSGPFLLTSIFVCGVVTATGVLLQRWRAPRTVVTAVQLLVLAELVAFVFLNDTLRFGVLPWKQTALAFNQAMVDALDGINRFSAPLPPESYFTLFATSVVGLAGLLVHVVAVQFRQAAWAGLVLLMMYTVPAATVPGGLPTFLFVPPALGYIILLSAEGRSRLTRWGRRIGGLSALDSSTEVEASAAGQAGRRIGLSVIALALLLPAFLPSLPEGVLGNGVAGSGIGGGGGNTVSMGVNPMLDMGRNLRRGENSVALRYTGEGPVYLRMTTLDQFDGRTWQLSPRDNQHNVDGIFPTPPGLTTTDEIPQHKYRVNVDKWLRSTWVPMPYPTRELSINGKWHYALPTLDVQSANNRTTAGMKYTVTSYEVNPTEEALRSAINIAPPDQYTAQVPPNVPSSIRAKAQEVTAAAKGNHYLQATELQDWFRSADNFTYSTSNQDGSGISALEDFLFESKTGYCEQFATAMALMARTLGIPARVALGFLPGTLDKDGKYVVQMHDMHAWPELYFDGVGWVRFEPTPALASAIPPAWSIPTNPDPGQSPSTTPTALPTSGESDNAHQPNFPNEEDVKDGAAGTAQDTGGWWSHPAVRWGTAGVGAIALALLPWLVRILVRRRRFGRAPGTAAVEGLWAELRDTARDLGLDWRDSSTPRQTGAWLQTKLPPDQRAQATRLARVVEQSRYAGAAPSDIDVRAEAVAIRTALIGSATVAGRWRARLLPRSWRWYLSRGTSEASDLLDQFDLGLARMRSFLVPRRRPTA
jgi:transglutaminase-like putative cysteine protease